jgi:hypothetical protein
VAAETLSPESFTTAHNDFLAVILGPEVPEELQDYCAWYINFLQFKVTEAWGTLFIPVLKVSVATTPSNEEFSIAFHIFRIIVLQLRRKNLALSDIVDTLYNDKLVRFTDVERSNANQLVLASLGWISELRLLLLLLPSRLIVK